jgi:hypothetical protein
MSSSELFVTPRSVQKAKVQRVHVETACPSTDCSYPILIILLCVLLCVLNVEYLKVMWYYCYMYIHC